MQQSPSWEANRFSASQEITCIYVTQRLITAFTSACHLFLSWARSIHSMPPSHSISWRFIFILSYHLRLCLPWDLFPSHLPTETLYAPSVSHIYIMSCHILYYMYTHTHTHTHICRYDILVNCNWVDTQWQQYSTHVHTNNTQNNTKILEECGPCPVFVGFTLVFALQLRKKQEKTSARVAEECQL